jgi:hypothetical protein
MPLFHLVHSTTGRTPLCLFDGDRLRAVRAIARVGGRRVLLFCVVDDHVHVVVHADRPDAGRLGRGLRMALRAISPEADIEAAFVRPVSSRAHLEHLAHDYIVKNPVKHGVSSTPALWSGSCFADLVGARLLPGFDPSAIVAWLPRFRPSQLYAAVGVDPHLDLSVHRDLRTVSPATLAAAAAASIAATDLSGRDPLAVAARRTGARLALDAGHPHAAVREAFHLPSRSLRRAAVDGALVAAVRRRLALEEAARPVSRPAPAERQLAPT